MRTAPYPTFDVLCTNSFEDEDEKYSPTANKSHSVEIEILFNVSDFEESAFPNAYCAIKLPFDENCPIIKSSTPIFVDPTVVITPLQSA